MLKKVQTGCYIKATKVPQDALDPSYDFMTRRVGGLVEIDHTRADVRFEVASMRCASVGNWSIVGGANEHCESVSCSI
jgi:hypothetical protein